LILIFFDDFFPRKKKNIKILTATVTKSLLWCLTRRKVVHLSLSVSIKMAMKNNNKKMWKIKSKKKDWPVSYTFLRTPISSSLRSFHGRIQPPPLVYI
jgi:hypothetical protein